MAVDKRVSELPDFPYKDLVREAERRGKEAVRGNLNDGASVVLLGLCQIVGELRDELKRHSHGSQLRD